MAKSLDITAWGTINSDKNITTWANVYEQKAWLCSDCLTHNRCKLLTNKKTKQKKTAVYLCQFLLGSETIMILVTTISIDANSHIDAYLTPNCFLSNSQLHLICSGSFRDKRSAESFHKQGIFQCLQNIPCSVTVSTVAAE